MSTTTTARRFPVPLAAIILGVILFIAVNLFATLKLEGSRLDLTEQSLFTLKDSTRQVLAGITEPVTLKLYRSSQFVDSVAELHAHAIQVSELLSTFAQISDGKVRVETVETAPFSTEEDEALAYGLRGFNLNPQGERGYFGLVGTNSLDSLETIEFLDPSRGAFLQYDLTRIVYRLSHPDEPKVGIIDGLNMFGSAAQGRQPWAVLNLIGQNYALSPIPGDADIIPADTNVLLVTHPAQLSATQQYAIDQYVLGGGAALVFVDPVAENSPPDVNNPQMPQNPSSDLAALTAAWGVKMDPAFVVGDSDMALQTVGVAGQQRVVADYLPWLKVDGDAFDRNDAVTARLEVMRISSAGAIKTEPGATTTVTPLIQSTGNSMLLKEADVVMRPNPNVLLDQFVPSGERQAMAVRITGPAKTAFPDGKPPAAADAPVSPAPPPSQLKDGNINVILVADTDLLANSHVVDDQGRLLSSNADFVLNAIDNLAGGDALIGLRGGGLANRPFTTVQAIQARAEQTYRATEQRLTQELAEAQQKLAQLQAPDAATGSDPLAASREQQNTVTEYNARILDLRRQLREVQVALRSEIEALDNRLRLINIALVPALIVVAALLLALWRRVRLRRYLRTVPPAGA